MTKSILITGCSSGIGLDAAQMMQRRGWRVFASCRKPEDCNRLREMGFDSPLIDYENPITFTPAIEEILAATGGTLDAVFHNGAYAIPGPLEDISPDAMRTIFQANFLGWHELTQKLLPVMRDQGHGRIVLNSSILGFIGTKWRGAYVSTKFALEGWADVMRLELESEDIQVVLIEPGPITSEFRNNAIKQFEKWVDWENSPRADEYRSTLLDKLYKGSGEMKGTLPASAVSEKLFQAVTEIDPPARYRVTMPTQAMAVAKRILPQAVLDWILKRA